MDRAVICLAALSLILSQQAAVLDWRELAALPDPIGLAGPIAGVSGNALLVAGGANFPDGPPWDGNAKVWHDSIFVLESDDGAWRELDQTLPRPLAYGAAATWRESLVWAGGGDSEAHYDLTTRWTWDKGTLIETPLPPLPYPLAFHSGAVVGDTFFVAGGIRTPGARIAETGFFSLDLTNPTATWTAEQTWEGPGRMLAVAGALEGAFFLFGGVELVDGERRYLTDAHRFTPGAGWARVNDLPRAAAGAPSPAPALGLSHILVLGGDPGEHATADLRDRHPGFDRSILAYHAITDTWRRLGDMPPWPAVTTAAVAWEGVWVVPSGEVRPGVRTNRVLSGKARVETQGFGGLDFLVIGLYFAALVGMGLFFARRGRTTEDFFLGGRRIPWWAAGLSIYGTQLSAITFMAIPAKAYATNWAYWMGNFTILLAAPFVVKLYLPFFRRLNITTAYEYLERRFSVSVRMLGSGAYLLFQLGRMGIVLYLPALALAAVTGTDIRLCILAMGILATAYATLGGIEAVIWTDVLQVVVLIGGAILSLVIIAGEVDGGLGGIYADAFAADKLRLANPGWSLTRDCLWVVVLGNFFFSIVSYTSDQSVVQRYLTTSSERQAARSIWTNGLLSVPSAVLFFGLGTALWAFYRAHPEKLAATGRTDDIFPWFIAGEMPAGIAGLVIAGLFAAAMSSLDSSMNSMATALTKDFYQRLRPRSTDLQRLRLARLLTVVLGAAGTATALYLAARGDTSMLDQYLKVIGLLGGGLAGLFALGIFTRGANSIGAITGFAGSAVILAWAQHSGAVHFLLYAVVGVCSCFALGWAVGVISGGSGRDLSGLTLFTSGGELDPEGRGGHADAESR